MKKCIYCLSTTSAFSREHIWPDRLGGELCQPLITESVCEKCNNLCGLYVDAPFIKCFFIKNELVVDRGEYTFIGKLDIQEVDNHICDVWMGKGGIVFHWYPKTEDFNTYIGGDPCKTKRSRAYLYFGQPVHGDRANEIVNRFLSEFKKAKCFAGNFEFDNAQFAKLHRIGDTVFSKAESQALSEYANNANNQNSLNLKVHFTIQLGFEERFLAKLCLGIGHGLLGEQYLETQVVTGPNSSYQLDVEELGSYHSLHIIAGIRRIPALGEFSGCLVA